MAVTPLKFSSPDGHTPIPGHSFPSSNKMRQFTKWVESKENRSTPFTDWLTRGGDEYEQVEYEVGQSYTPYITSAIKATTATDSANVDIDLTTYFRAGDVIEIIDYYEDSTTELDYSTREYATVLSVTDADTLVTKRHQGERDSGEWAVHPVDSFVRVKGRATNYNAEFPDGITWRGDIITNYIQRIDSGEIPYDVFVARGGAPTYESTNQMQEDKAKWRKILLEYRESAFIEGRKVAGDYSASPKVPYELGGAIWWAEQKTSNLFDIDGNLLSIFDFADALRLKAEVHDDGPGLTLWGGPLTVSCMDSMLLPFMQGRFSDTKITARLDQMSFRFGDVKTRTARTWPEGKILLTDKSNWRWNNAKNMDWKQIERGPEHIGAYQESWNMFGDFGFECLDVQRQILFYDIDTRIDLYAGRNIGL